jgi:hypothetical protein
MNEDNINFKIEDINIEANRILVRPLSPNFKNPPEYYSPINITITTLDPNSDLTTQIAQAVAPLIFAILRQEADTSVYLSSLSSLSTVSSNVYTVPISQVYPNIQQFPTMPMGYIPLSAIENRADQIAVNLLQSTLTPLVTSQIFEGIEFIN